MINKIQSLIIPNAVGCCLTIILLYTHKPIDGFSISLLLFAGLCTYNLGVALALEREHILRRKIK